MYAPYQFYDSAYRGNLAETWALALLPWVLWAGRRAAVGTGSHQSRASRWLAIVPLAGAYAALIYTHNVYALISSPVLGLYLLLLWWIGRSKSVAAVSESRAVARTASGDRDRVHGRGIPRCWKARLRRLDVEGLLRLGAGIALGLALSAFFWLPAFGERGWTRFSTELVDYRTFFLDVRELLALPPRGGPVVVEFLPPAQFELGDVGVDWGWRNRCCQQAAPAGMEINPRPDRVRRRRRKTCQVFWRRVWRPSGQGFFAVVFVGAAFLTVRASDLLWRTVPLLGYALIPWRFLGIASLAGSVVAGASIALLPDRPTLRSPALLGTCIAIALLIAAALPWTYATPVGQRAEYGVADIVGWEYSSKLIGTTAKNEFLPIWSDRLPPEPADPALLTEADPIIARLDKSSLPDGARVLSADYGLMRAELEIDTPRAFRALYKQLYFPGWRVTIDGKKAAQIATAPYGLLGFEVPAGRHRIVVRPTTTPLRLAGSIVSGLALAGIVTSFGLRVAGFKSGLWSARAVGGRASKPGRTKTFAGDAPPTAESLPVDAGRPDRYNAHDRRSDASRLGPAISVPASLALVSWVGHCRPGPVAAGRQGGLDRPHAEPVSRAALRSGGRPRPLPGVQVETAVNFGDAFTLLGYRLPRQPTLSGEPLRVDLYLSARHPPEARAGQGAYMAYARLVDDEGRLWSLPVQWRAGGTPPAAGDDDLADRRLRPLGLPGLHLARHAAGDLLDRGRAL